MSTLSRRLTKYAGFEKTWHWPIQVADGENVEDADVLALFTSKATDIATTDQTTVTITASDDDPAVGIVAVTLSVPDTQPAGVYTLRVDVDKASGAPLDNDDGIEITILAPSAQRP